MKNNLLLILLLFGTPFVINAQDNIANPTSNHANVTSGKENTSIGVKADSALTTGSGNTAIGFKALKGNKTNNDNVAIGSYAGANNVGNENILIGSHAGENNTAKRNILIGTGAGSEKNEGDDNVMIGDEAGKENDKGENNVFIGREAGKDSDDGNNNVFIGKSSGEINKDGEKNTFIGYRSGHSSVDAKSVVVIGDSAGVNSLGNRNVFIGSESGNTITSGKNNVFIGARTASVGPDSVDLENSVAIGIDAKVAISDAIILGDTANTDIKVGIGTASPKHKLDVVGVVNMRVAYGGNAMKVNDKTIVAVNESGDAVFQNIKVQYNTEAEWSDKVYENDYQLMPIVEMGDFVRKNKHLPNVPSAKEVVENGVEVNVMLSKLLEKIEEQSLYILQLKNELDIVKSKLK